MKNIRRYITDDKNIKQGKGIKSMRRLGKVS